MRIVAPAFTPGEFCGYQSPDDLPVDLPTKFELTINLATAKTAAISSNCAPFKASRMRTGKGPKNRLVTFWRTKASAQPLVNDCTGAFQTRVQLCTHRPVQPRLQASPGLRSTERLRLAGYQPINSRVATTLFTPPSWVARFSSTVSQELRMRRAPTASAFRSGTWGERSFAHHHSGGPSGLAEFHKSTGLAWTARFCNGRLRATGSPILPPAPALRSKLP
jgi:hypothetical protein